MLLWSSKRVSLAKIKVSAGLVPSGGPRRESIPLPFQLPEAPSVLGSWPLPPSSKPEAHHLGFPSDSDPKIISHVKILNLLPSAEPLATEGNVCVRGFWGLGCGRLGRQWFCRPQRGGDSPERTRVWRRQSCALIRLHRSLAGGDTCLVRWVGCSSQPGKD